MGNERLRQTRLNDQVHYVSYGTPGGEYRSQCRAATVTEVGAWVTVETTKADSYGTSEGRPIRHLEQWFYRDACALAVFNPTGIFLNQVLYHDGYADGQTEREFLGGTWHGPESCDS